MKNKNLLGTLQLLLAAFIWGSAFVAQSDGMNYVGPLTFTSVRFALGGIVLIPVILIRNAASKRNVAYEPENKSGIKHTLTGGIICGILLATAAAFQQFGILYTSVSKAGFITTLYVIFVPLCGLFMKKKLGGNLWIAVVLATVGLYLLCMSEGLKLSVGDILVFMCAISYTAQIIAVERFSKKIDPVLLSSLQFLTVGAVTGIPALIFEKPDLASVLAAWLPILYAGIMSSGVAFTLQVVAQRYTDATIAAITMSFESVFAVLAGWAILGESLTLREGLGCAVMFCAIIIAQLPADMFKQRRNIRTRF